MPGARGCPGPEVARGQRRPTGPASLGQLAWRDGERQLAIDNGRYYWPCCQHRSLMYALLLSSVRAPRSMVKAARLGSAPARPGSASSGRAWWLRVARYSQSEAQPLGARPPPRVLERAASKAAHFTAFVLSGHMQSAPSCSSSSTRTQTCTARRATRSPPSRPRSRAVRCSTRTRHQSTGRTDHRRACCNVRARKEGLCII